MEQFDRLFEGMPPIVGNSISAAIILLIGFIVAFIIKSVVAGGINRTGLGKKAQTSGGNIGNAIGRALFWLVVLYAAYLALGRLGLSENLGPVNGFFDNIGSYAANILGAGLLFIIGYFLAKVAQNAVTATLEAAQLDSLANKSGFTSATGSQGSIARALGTLVFVVIIALFSIAALDALDISGVSDPLSNMLSGFLNFIPELIGAAAILAVTIFIGRFVSEFLQDFLPSLGFDRSVNEIMMLDDGEGLKTSPSKAAGYVAFLIILVIGVSAAVNLLGNDSLSYAFGSVQEFGGSLLEAAILIIIGVFLASILGRFMSSVISPRIATFVKYAVMVLFIFIGLSSLDPEGQIVPIAFSSLVISAAVAAAIAFGVGGRDWAAKVLNNALPPSNVKPLGNDKAAPKKAPAKRSTRKPLK